MVNQNEMANPKVGNNQNMKQKMKKYHTTKGYNKHGIQRVRIEGGEVFNVAIVKLIYSSTK